MIVVLKILINIDVLVNRSMIHRLHHVKHGTKRTKFNIIPGA